MTPIGTIDPHTTHNPVYEEGYRHSWHWDYRGRITQLREWWKIRQHVIRPTGLEKGSRVLEVASGQGYHVNLFRRMGYRVTGVDISEAGIDFALRHFPQDDYRRIDAASPMPFPEQTFDLVWSHGAGFFHYCITDDATALIVADHLRYIRPGGHYLVLISTDLSGSRPQEPQLPWAFQWNHTLEDLRAMLGRHRDKGDIVDVHWFPIRRWVIGPRVRSGAGYAVAVLRVHH